MYPYPTEVLGIKGTESFNAVNTFLVEIFYYAIVCCKIKNHCYSSRYGHWKSRDTPPGQSD